MHSTGPLRRSSLPDDPFELLDTWLRQAENEETIQYPRAMCLSTVSPDGAPQGRFVIVHSVSAEGLVFLTDSRSPKALALAADPRAALTVYWPRPLEYQVRIEGVAEPAPGDLADRIFRTRPRRSQATPWASTQSRPTTLETLEAALDETDRRWPGTDPLPRPETWRAYRLVPQRMEFWRARPRRLHDRFLYRRAGAAWERVRLCP